MADAIPMLVRIIRMLQIPRMQEITLSLIIEMSLFAKTPQMFFGYGKMRVVVLQKSFFNQLLLKFKFSKLY
jgi:hypothetical protein